MSSWGDITLKNLVWGSRAWHGGATGTGGGELGQEGRPGGRQTRLPRQEEQLAGRPPYSLQGESG